MHGEEGGCIEEEEVKETTTGRARKGTGCISAKGGELEKGGASSLEGCGTIFFWTVMGRSVLEMTKVVDRQRAR
jgi:hypothetical protein